MGKGGSKRPFLFVFSPICKIMPSESLVPPGSSTEFENIQLKTLECPLGGWVRVALCRLSRACRRPHGGQGGGCGQAPLARVAGRAARLCQAGSAGIEVWGAAGPPSWLVSTGRRGLQGPGVSPVQGTSLWLPVPANPLGLSWLGLLSCRQVSGTWSAAGEQRVSAVLVSAPTSLPQLGGPLSLGWVLALAGLCQLSRGA